MRYVRLLLVALVLVALPVVVSAASPIDEKITGGAHFISDGEDAVGNMVYLSMVGMEKDGVWSGQGSYRDPQIGLEAKLTVDYGFRVAGDENYVCTEGSADIYLHDAFETTKDFRICLTDEDGDTTADRIGVILYDYYEPGRYYSHMGGTVRDYDGCMKIH